MFEVLHKEDAYVGVVNTSYASVRRGTICYKQGINSSGEVLLNVPTNSVLACGACYPIDKITMRDDLSDTVAAIDYFKKGERCIYYEGGIFRTDLVVGVGSIRSYSTPNFPTDTVAFTLASGRIVYLYTPTSSGNYGKLSSTSKGLYTNPAGTAPKNANFELIAAYNATPNAIYTYKVRPHRIGGYTYIIT